MGTRKSPIATSVTVIVTEWSKKSTACVSHCGVFIPYCLFVVKLCELL